jgi:4-amino-4-deoxy-L-arabinose transferase-like glycosyltransferase
MIGRAPVLVAVAASLFVTLAYQSRAPLTVKLGTRADGPTAEGFGGPGMTGGRSWRWTTAQSRVRLRGAGQVAPSGGILRIDLGVPRWAATQPRPVTLAIDGEPLGTVVVTSGFSSHEFQITAHGGAEDWIVSVAVEGADRARGVTRGVALAEVTLLPSPPPTTPASRTLLLTLLGVVSLLTLLSPRTGSRRAAVLALATAAALAAGLALGRQTVVLALPTATLTIVVLLTVDQIHRGGWLTRVTGRLASPQAAWIEWAVPPLALAALVLPGLGVWSVPAFGLSLVLVLLWVARARVVSARDAEAAGPRRHEALLVVGLAAIGFGFRLYDLEGVPFAIFRDEARHGLLALRLMGDPSYRPLFVGPPINQPLPYFLGVAAAIRAFGVDLFALRVVSAVAGAIAVPLLYLLVRAVLGSSEAAVAALLLAVSSWHVSISRFAVNYVEPSLFSLPAYLLLWRALPRARAAALALSALLIGLAQYSAHTAKPLLIVATGLVADEVVRLLVSRDLAKARRLALCLVLSAIVGIVSLGPLLLFLRQNADAYLARAEQVSIWTHAAIEKEPVETLLASNLVTYAGAFNALGDRNGRHHLPHAPFLDPLSGLGLLVGLAIALTRLSSRAHRFLILWLFAGVLPGILTVDAPSALRTVEAAPAVYAVAALGLVALWRRRPRRAVPGWPGAVALVVVAGVAWNAWTYFGRMYDSPTVWRHFAPIATHLGKRLQALRASGAVPSRLTLAMPREFLEAPDTRYVLELYWPEGLELATLEDRPDPLPVDEALVIPNYEAYWDLVTREEPRYARNARDAATSQPAWESAVPPDRQPIEGPSFPATDRPMFWLYLGRRPPRHTATQPGDFDRLAGLGSLGFVRAQDEPRPLRCCRVERSFFRGAVQPVPALFIEGAPGSS